MYELERGDYARVRALYKEWGHYLSVSAVLDGRCPGKVWADDLSEPRTGLLWEFAEGELFLASPGADEALSRSLNRCILERVYAEAREMPHLSEFTLYCEPLAWEGQLDIVLRDTHPMMHHRKCFALKKLRADWRGMIPEGFVLTEIDGELFSRTDLANHDVMAEWVLGLWRTPEDYQEQDIGTCLLHDNEVVSWCASEFTSLPARACEVGIYTSEAYRRQGFATLTAAATVERCLERGIEHIGWHCWSRNVASAATARKVGFELVAEHRVYNACFNRFDNHLLQAHYHRQADQVREALAAWEQGFAMWEAGDREARCSPHFAQHTDAIGWCYYAAGRVRAQLGEPHAALRYLHKAIDNRWADAERLARDEALVTLRQAPGWEALRARIDE